MSGDGAWTCTPPEWLLTADPARYAWEGSAFTVVDQQHALEVSCRGGRWSVSVDGRAVGEAELFGSFLTTLAQAGQALVELSDAEYSTPTVTATMDEGFASDLLWWLTEAYGGEIEVNGEEWDMHLLGAPAPSVPWGIRKATPWTVDCLIHWEAPARAGHHGGPGSDYSGTAFVGRLGSRFGLWVSDPAEFRREGPWTSLETVVNVVRREARDGGALSAWPARVEAPDPAVAEAVRGSLWYPAYWLNSTLVLPRSTFADTAPIPTIPVPAEPWRLRVAGSARGGGMTSELLLEAATERASTPVEGGRWNIPVDVAWLKANDANTLAHLCLSCDQHEYVRYGSLSIGGSTYETIDSDATAVKELAGRFGFDAILIAPSSAEQDALVIGCDRLGRALWSSRILGVEDVEAQAVELGRMTYELDFY